MFSTWAQPELPCALTAAAILRTRPLETNTYHFSRTDSGYVRALDLRILASECVYGLLTRRRRTYECIFETDSILDALKKAGRIRWYSAASELDTSNSTSSESLTS